MRNPLADVFLAGALTAVSSLPACGRTGVDGEMCPTVSLVREGEGKIQIKDMSSEMNKKVGELLITCEENGSKKPETSKKAGECKGESTALNGQKNPGPLSEGCQYHVITTHVPEQPDAASWHTSPMGGVPALSRYIPCDGLTKERLIKIVTGPSAEFATFEIPVLCFQNPLTSHQTSSP